MATFDDVYRRHLPTVLRAAVRAVGRRDVAEEITADAFLELYRQYDRIDTALLPGWLLTVMRHRAVDYWRRQQVERRYLGGEAAGGAPSADAPAAPLHLFTHESLKPVHRACLILRYVHGLSREDIARRLGLSPTQVRGHLQYALVLLRKHVVAEQP
jgi:RNA polymerase sigma-70 factor (ECF subfamily)